MPQRLPLLALLFLALFVAGGCSDGEGEGDPQLSFGAAANLESATAGTIEATRPTSVESVSEPTAVATATVASTAEGPSPGTTPDATDAELEAAIRALTADDPAVSVVVRQLAGDSSVAINSEQTYYTASLFKVFVMYEVYRQRDLGNLTFDEEMEVTQEWIDLAIGQSQYTTAGEVVTINRALRAMITLSDNVTANMLADRAGWDSIRASATRLGLSQTVLGGGELLTTAGDMSAFMEALYRGDDLGRATSDEMIALLSDQLVRDRIPKYLPAGTRVAHKTGSWDDVTHDAGIVFGPSGPYVIVVMAGRGNAHETVAQISQLVYQYYNPDGP